MGKRARPRWFQRIQRLSFQQLIAVAATAISVVFLLAFGGQIIEIYRLRNALATADERVEALRKEQERLIATRTYVESDEYIERVARAELNKIRPGDERAIIIEQPAPAPTPLPTPVPAPPILPPSDYVAEWWELLFGS